MKNKILIINLTKDPEDNLIANSYNKLKNNSTTIDFINGPRQGIDEQCAGVIISGSATHVFETEENPWIIEIEQYIQKWLDQNIPILGICFGLQLYADMTNREVPINQIGRNMGRYTMVVDQTKNLNHFIFDGLDTTKNIEIFCSHVYHVEPNQNIYGYLKNDQNYLIPMLEIYNSFIGLQFHPDFSTPNGIEKLKNLVENRRDLLIKDGKDPNKILLDLYKIGQNSTNHPSLKFLTNFVDHCLI